MKDMKKFLGFIALVVLVVLPLKVNAESYGINWEGTKPDDDGYFTVTVKGTQTGGGTIDNFVATMTLNNVEYVDGAEVTNGQWSVIRESTKLTFTSGVAVSDANFTVATLKFKKIDTAAECSVVFECLGTTKTVTPNPKTTKNPKTGSALPYAVIAVGAMMAVAVYYVTRKNTKLYRI